jgi:phage terminase large subunit
MDFGFTNDPTTLTAIYQYNGAYIFDELIYQTGLTNNDIHNLMKSKGIRKNVSIYADSAEPKTIKELSRSGWQIVGASKGKDSVMFGISKMQENRFKVTKNSVNLIKELRSYTWDKDKEGKQLNKPIDAFNHAIDGIRYYFTTMNKNKGKYYVG